MVDPQKKAFLSFEIKTVNKFCTHIFLACAGALCARASQNFGIWLLKLYLTFDYLTCSVQSKQISTLHPMYWRWKLKDRKDDSCLFLVDFITLWSRYMRITVESQNPMWANERGPGYLINNRWGIPKMSVQYQYCTSVHAAYSNILDKSFVKNQSRP